MENEDFGSIESSLTFAERIYLLLGDLKLIVGLGIALSLVAVFSAITIYFGFIGEAFGTLAGLGGILSLGTIYFGYKTYSELKRWESGFTRFSYLLKFEIFPLIGVNSQDKILNHLLNVFLKYKQLLDDISLDTFFNVKVRGREKEHIFDVYISSESVDEISSTSEGYEGAIFVKIFAEKKSVSSNDLSNLREEISDVIKGKYFFSSKETLFRVVVVSKSTFTEDAINYVKDKKNWIQKRSFDLIEEKINGYNVVWIA